MRYLYVLFAAGAFICHCPFVSSAPFKRSAESFFTAEVPIALQGILDNVGSTGKNAAGASSGIVIASPSKTNPDYFYTWTRDSALTFRVLVDAFVGNNSVTLQSEINNYITAQAQLQTVSNPSGGLTTGGLGEPKFNVDGTAFTGQWGRPQRDGPALRASALMAYARWLVANGQTSTATSTVWHIIRNDLGYVTQYWNQTGFDLWEEINGSSFFTLAVQHRALVEGSALAKQLGQTCANCDSVVPQIVNFLQDFWDASEGHILANINTNDGRSGKDANTLLGAIHALDPTAGCDASTFQPCSDKALANHKVVMDAFRFYGINAGTPRGYALAVGRYPEDTYKGGNPWYLCTLAAAEQLYDALYVWGQQGTINVTEVSLAFFQDHQPSVAVGSYTKGDGTYESLYNVIESYADGYVGITQTHTPAGGALAEQYDRNSGDALSAADLTWSYASLLTAAQARSAMSA